MKQIGLTRSFLHNAPLMASKTPQQEHWRDSVMTVARKQVATLEQELTVGQALEAIRKRGTGERIVYFYVVNHREELVGVVPTRRLLSANPEQLLVDIMVRQVAAIPQTATVLEACEAFVLHKFLAFPVIDYRKRIVGVVDVTLLTDEVFDVAEKERVDELFETIGFHVSQVRDASPVRAFRFRFPWLLATIASGTVCALLASAFEATLAKTIVLAFFLTLVLGLGESVSIQSMTLTIQALRAVRPTFRWYIRALFKESGTALFLGAACGIVVAAIVWAWRGTPLAAVSIGLSIFLTLCAACFFGWSVPALLHALKLDPKIAAGPVTLAFTDICTLLAYFGIAALLL